MSTDTSGEVDVPVDATTRLTLCMSDALRSEIDRQVARGAAKSRSQWVQTAAWYFLEMQELGLNRIQIQADDDVVAKVDLGETTPPSGPQEVYADEQLE